VKSRISSHLIPYNCPLNWWCSQPSGPTICLYDIRWFEDDWMYKQINLFWLNNYFYIISRCNISINVRIRKRNKNSHFKCIVRSKPKCQHVLFLKIFEYFCHKNGSNKSIHILIKLNFIVSTQLIRNDKIALYFAQIIIYVAVFLPSRLEDIRS